MPTIDLSLKDSVLNTFVSELRDVNIQDDPIRFRKNLNRIGEVLAYEISKGLRFTSRKIQTPLAVHQVNEIDDSIVLATILRAGLPLHQGFLNYFDRAENAFISAYRKYNGKSDFEIHVEYNSSPDLTGKTLILIDPMLATGLSFELAYEALLKNGEPQDVHFASAIASRQGVDYLTEKLDMDKISIWCAAIDPELNQKSYIVPGLGDAGDLAFGEKL